MKKIMFAITVSLMMLAMMTSCGVDKSDPQSVAEAAVKCLKSQDYEGLMKLSNASPEDQAQYVTLLNEKMSKDIERKGGLKSIEVTGEESIDLERGKARYSTLTVYGNGEEEEGTLKLKRADNGEWQIDANK